MLEIFLKLSRWQKLSRVNRLAIAPDLEMQSRLAFRPLPHGRYFLAFFNLLSFFDQERRRVPVGTQVGVVVFEDNKLAVSDQSTARVNHSPRRRSDYGLSGLTVYQYAGSGTWLCAKFHIDPAIRGP